MRKLLSVVLALCMLANAVGFAELADTAPLLEDEEIVFESMEESEAGDIPDEGEASTLLKLTVKNVPEGVQLSVDAEGDVIWQAQEGTDVNTVDEKAWKNVAEGAVCIVAPETDMLYRAVVDGEELMVSEIVAVAAVEGPAASKESELIPVLDEAEEAASTVEPEQHVHEYAEDVVTPATCTEDGLATYTCDCGECYTQVIPAEGHRYVDGYCSVCNESIPDEPVSLLSVEEDSLIFVTDITLSETEATLCYNNPEDQLMLTAVVEPEDATDKAIVWSSSDESVATVQDGIVTPVGEGTTRILCTAADESGVYAVCRVTVIPNYIMASGDCGESVHWSLENTGVFTLSGSGPMTDYKGTAPWYADYRSVISKVIIEEGVTSIGNYAFMRCANLTEIDLASTVSVIGNQAFANCSGLTSFVVPDTVKTIGSNAFGSCTAMASVDLGNGLTTLGANAFQYCSGLTSIVIPATLQALDCSSFRYCSGLETITIPYTVTEITGEFEECASNLTIVCHEGSAAAVYADENGITAEISEHYMVNDVCSICGYATPSVAAGTCGAELNWNLDGHGLLTITGNGAMTDYSYSTTRWDGNGSKIAKVEIGEGVTTIGTYAFYSCGNLQSISIPETVTSIGSSAFYGCSKLESVQMPESVTAIGGSAFYNCSALTEVKLPSKLSVLNSKLFYGCDKLTRITIPEGVTEVKDWVFTKGDSASGTLKYITWSDNVTTLSSYALKYSGTSNSYLVNAIHYAKAGTTTADTLTKYGVSFVSPNEPDLYVKQYTDGEGKKYLTITGYLGEGGAVTIPATIDGVPVKSIANSVFSGKATITSIEIEEGITSIGSSAFYGCSALTEVKLPSKLSVLNSKLFYGCDKLTRITIPEGVTEVKDWVFTKGDSASGTLKYITWSDNVTTLSSYALKYSGTSNSYLVNAIHYAKAGTTTADTLAKYGVSFVSPNEPDLYVKQYTEDEGAKYLTITGYLGEGGAVTIPSTIDGVPVKSIASDAFYGKATITSIEIEEGITSIGSGAFYGCSKLESVQIPESVTAIGGSAFYNCSALTEVKLPSKLSVLNSKLFYGCDKLTRITIPEGVTEVKDWVFTKGDSASGTLKYITWSDNVTTLSSYALKYSGTSNSYLVNAIHYAKAETTTAKTLTAYGISFVSPSVPDLCLQQYIGEDGEPCVKVTGYCGNGEAVTIPAMIDGVPVKSIASDAFYGKATITSIEIEEGITSIGSSTFYGCSKLESVQIPESVTAIGRSAFYNCSALTEVKLPSKLSVLNENLFYDCDKLTRITIPEGVTTVNDYAFARSSTGGALKYITWSDNVETLTEYALKYTYYYSGTRYALVDAIHYAKAGTTTAKTLTAYGISFLSPSAPDLRLQQYMGEDGEPCVKVTGYCGTGGAVTIPATIDGVPVKLIANEAFKNKSTVTSIEVEEGIEKVDASSFYGCSGLQSISIPETVTTIGASAFYGCRKLESIQIPESVTAIGESAFYNCSALTEVKLPSKLSVLNENLFYDCDKLTRITIPEGVTTVNDYAFARSSTGGALKYITWSDNVETLTAYALKYTYYYNGTRYALVDAIHYAKAGTTTAKTLTAYGISFVSPSAPDLRLQQYMGEDGEPCVKVTGYCGTGGAVTIPATIDGVPVKLIANEAFKNKSTVTSIEVEEGIEKVDASSFYGCSGLQSISIPETVTTIGASAFYGCRKLESIQIPESVTAIGESAFYNCSALTEVKLPSKLSVLNENLFYDCDKLTRITIPEGVTTVNDYAFARSSTGGALKYITWSDNVETLTEYALKYTYYYSGTRYALVDAIHYAKAGTTTAKTLTAYGISFVSPSAPDLRLQQYMGEDGEPCVKVTGYCGTGGAVTIPATIDGVPVKLIANEAFKNKSTVTSIEVEEGIEKVDASSFYGCSGLQSISIPETVTTIGASAFYGCSKLESIQIPESVTAIGESAFYNCSALTEVKLPSKLSVLNENLFYDCDKLTRITIPEGVTTVNDYAFARSSAGGALKYITWSDNVETLTAYALKYTYYYNGTRYALVDAIHYAKAGTTTAKTLTAYGISFVSPSAPDLRLQQYMGEDGEPCVKVTGYCGTGGAVTIPATIDGVPVKLIANEAFKNKSTVTSIEVEEGIEKVDASSFYGCSGLQSISIPETVTTIGASAFYGCSKLESIQIPESVTAIGESAFYNCSALTEVKLPSKLSVLNENLFYDCDKLTRITIPEGVTTVNDYAFARSNASGALKYITWSDNVETLTAYALKYTYYYSGTRYALVDAIHYAKAGTTTAKTLTAYGISFVSPSAPDLYLKQYDDGEGGYYVTITGCCGNSGSIRIPATIDGIAVRPFDSGLLSSNSSITSVTIDESITEIGEKMFYNCKYIKDFYLHDNITAVGTDAFYGCSAARYHFELGTVTAETMKGVGITKFVMSANPDYVVEASTIEGITTLTIVSYIGKDGVEVCIPDEIGGYKITSINSSAFSGYTKLTMKAYPNSVGAQFCKDNNITYTAVSFQTKDGVLIRYRGVKSDVVIPSEITAIANGAFADCTFVTNVHIHNAVESIGANAFDGCTGIEQITIPASVTSLGENAFIGCTSLEKITFLDEDAKLALPETIFSNNPEVYCYKNSLIETKAAEKGCTVVLLDQDYKNYGVVTTTAEISLKYGKRATVAYSVYPEIRDLTYTWSSSDEDVATVDQFGVVTATGAGDAVITLDVNGAQAETVVHVDAPITSFDMAKDAVWVEVGYTVQLGITNAVPVRHNEEIFTWSVAQSTIASVDENGLVTANEVGDTEITVKSATGVTRTCTVHVRRSAQTVAFAFDELWIKEGESQAIKVTVTDDRGNKYTNVLNTLESSDTDIVSVDSDGTIHALAIGSATLTAATGSGKSATCTIRVECSGEHVPEDVAEVHQTCTETGVAAGTRCSICKKPLSGFEEIPADGHIPGEAVQENIVNSTCEVEGSYDSVIYCTVCGAELERTTMTIPMHTIVIDKRVEPTYETTGLTEGSHCSVCGTVFDAQEVIPCLDCPEFNVRALKNTATVNMGDHLRLIPDYITNNGWKISEYKTSSAKIATVSNGVVTPVNEGKATITIKCTNKKSLTVVVTVVNPNKPTAVRLNYVGTQTLDLRNEGEFKLVATQMPETAKGLIEYKSSSLKVAAVDKESGVVTPIAEGTATITVTCTYGKIKKTASMKVKVVDSWKPTAVSLNNGGNYTVYLGNEEGLQLDPITTPVTAKDHCTYEYKSSSSKIATVDSKNGLVMPVAEGTATITVTCIYKGVKKTGTVKVTVADPKKPTAVALNHTGTYTLYLNGEELQLEATQMPATAEGTYTYKSSSPKVAMVDAQTGIVKPVAEGTATITVTCAYEKIKKTATLKVIVADPKKPVSVALNHSGTYTLYLDKGEKLQLEATKTPATAEGNCTYKSSSPKVANVGYESGLVTPVAEGTATITVTCVRGSITKKATLKVVVADSRKPVSVKLNYSGTKTLKVGQALQLQAEVLPETAVCTYAYKSSAPKIATVDPTTGKVTAMAAGTATITVTATSKAFPTIKKTTTVKVKVVK